MLSLIIPTRNRADLLEKALESIVIHNFPVSQFEVIVVNNGFKNNYTRNSTRFCWKVTKYTVWIWTSAKPSCRKAL